MINALIVTLDAGGNVPPALGIAQRIADGGGRVLVLGSPSQQQVVTAAGVPFAPFRHEQPWAAARPVTLVQNLAQVSRTMADTGIAADTVRVARREAAEVVLVDCMLLGAIRASVIAELPTAVLVHTLPSYFAGPYAHGPVGAVATLRGLRPARVWASALGTVATVLPGFDGGSTGPWPALRQVGPVTPRLSASPTPTPRSRPRVLVSLSTIWFPGQQATMQKLLDAVADLDVDALVTTGRGVDVDALRAPANVQLEPYVDHDAVLPDVDLLVGHGGHGTTMRALANGVPVLVIPSFRFTDQPLVGGRVAASGAGAVLPARSSVQTLRQAIADLAGSGPHRDAAADLRARIQALDPAADAVAHLTRLADRSAAF